MLGHPPKTASPLILAHRGFHVHVPENTLDAFSAAADAGVDGIETDIRSDVDGVPILFHDRLARNGSPVNSLTRAELASVVGYPVPTLVEALDWGKDLVWDLEIKTPEVADA